ncbi:hypothetical protein [Halomonas halocynthiae]|uniref:hypothetical protein n=1 Tax=Halomonas halocynthiae TaxID=176290 RepID=UPI0003FE2109|nr:hypothetical protein [Halomonas halocynthiae]
MRYATLGPTGSNHELVLKRYLRHTHNTPPTSAPSSIQLFNNFNAAFDALLTGKVDRVLQCSAHVSHSECVGRFMHRAFPVDTFIAGSRPLALLARHSATLPTRVGLQPATRHYTDLSAFAEQVEMPTIVDVANGLLSAQFDAGICALETQQRHPETLRLIKNLGPALDVWILFSTQPLPNDDPRVI